MRSLWLTLSLLATLTATAAPPPSADEIVARYVAARGGAEKIAALRTLVFRGEYHEGDHTNGEAVMALMRPYYKLVGDPDKPITDFAEGYDGSAWEFYGDPGLVLRTVGEASAAGRHRARFDHPLVNYKTFGTKVELAGEDHVGDRPVWRLIMTMEDGFREEALVDQQTYLLLAERKAAPIHAYGAAVLSETRYSDFRPVEGVLFSFKSSEVEIKSGKVLSEFTTKTIVANHDYDPAVFSPPAFQRTPLGELVEKLYAMRDDTSAVMWSYHDFRRAHPELDTHDAAQVAGYQMVKMKALPAAIALLEANAAAYPAVGAAHFGVGRAYRTAGDNAKAKAAFQRALTAAEPDKRADDALKALK
jgi:hypothetical protein